MKKITKLMAVILVVTLLLATLSACGVNGTYYLVVDGEKSDSVWIKIDGETWEDSLGLSGECEVDGNEITMSKTLLGMKVDYMTGEKSGSTITFSVLGAEVVYEK